MKYLVEFIGTFFLVLTVGLMVFVKEPDKPSDLAPLAIGSVLMVMIYAGGHVSGAHYNPAVSLAVWIRGKLSTPDLGLYVAVQIAGGVIGAVLAHYLKGRPTLTPPDPDPLRALIAEFLFTFALAYVVLNVATARAASGNSYYGLAIGFTVLAGAFAVGPISGAAFNPAVAAGVTAVGAVKAANVWIYLVGCFGGGALAGILFRTMHPTDV
jgi:aquaporin Z